MKKKVLALSIAAMFGGRTEGKSKLNLVLLKERTSTSEPVYVINYDLLTIDETKGENNDTPRSLVETQENYGNLSDE